MIKTLSAANRGEREHFKIPRSVQQSIPVQRIYKGGITYLGILRSGKSRSQILPALQIIDQQTFDAAQDITRQRSRTHEATRHVPLNIRGNSLLAGNVFCGHCGARLSLTTNGKGRVRQDGTDAVRVRYVCQTKTRKHEHCDGQTGYTQSKLDGIIDEIVHEIFGRVKSFSRAEVLGVGHKSKMEERQALARKAQREYAKVERDLQGLKGEVIKAVNGGSAFPLDLLSELVRDTEQKCRDLREQAIAAQNAAAEGETILQEMKMQYTQLIEWSQAYEHSAMEARKMIVAQLIERVDVFRDYRLQIKFTISVEQFLQGLDISA